MTAIPSEDRQPRRLHLKKWAVLAVFLLAWNGLAAYHSSPMTLLQSYDGTQYHLLARNRLHGHVEVADTAHTVRREGAHPMWRPGLVLLTEQIAGLVGSVRLAAALGSALGTTLMEMALLWLTWRCFGVTTCAVAFFCLVAPLSIATQLLRLAIGAGPEPWATGFILLGLAVLAEALRRPSWRLAAAAGLAAGLAEWFRTGNSIMFGAPCAVYVLAALGRRDRTALVAPVLAVACFMVSASMGGQLTPSAVNKTTANLWGNLVETHGPQLSKEIPTFGTSVYHMGGLTIVPGTNETNYDHVVRLSHDISSREFFEKHSEEFVPLYLSRLADVFSSCALGLRLHTGEVLFALFLGQLAVSLIRRNREDIHLLAIGGGATAFFLGPVVLLRGGELTQYVLVMVPLMIPVAARGAVGIGQLLWTGFRSCRPELAEGILRQRLSILALGAAPVMCLCLSFYSGALASFQKYEKQSVTEQANLDALNLEGRTVACRNMSWFVDRDVQTVLFPYATVPKLEAYVRANGADGILVWENEPSLFLYGNPYGSFGNLDQEMRKSQTFAPPRVSGAWRWYAVRSAQPLGPVGCVGFSGRQPVSTIQPANDPKTRRTLPLKGE